MRNLERERQALDALAVLGAARTWEVAEAIGLGRTGGAVIDALNELRKQGLVDVVSRNTDLVVNQATRRPVQSHRWRVTEDGRLLAARPS